MLCSKTTGRDRKKGPISLCTLHHSTVAVDSLTLPLDEQSINVDLFAPPLFDKFCF